MRLEFDVTKCIRTKSKFASCIKCEEVSCGHIVIKDNLPSFQNQTGIEAAPSIGVCPTEALSFSGISLTEFFFNFIETQSDTLSVTEQLPCLSMLSVEHLLALALGTENNIKVNLGSYKRDSEQFLQIISRVEESNCILSFFSQKKIEIILYDTKEPPKQKTKKTSRRDFLSSFSLKGAFKQKKIFEDSVISDEFREHTLKLDDIAKLKMQTIPDKRKILFSVLKQLGILQETLLIQEDILSFVSDKLIDASCTNCQMCYRLCPSGALSSDGKFSLINFDATLCLKCHLCHDVCEADAIMMHSHFDLVKLITLEKKKLISFDIQRCDECGNSFTYKGGEKICQRCQIEEDEALALENQSGIIF
jgi:ferredoxin